MAFTQKEFDAIYDAFDAQINFLQALEEYARTPNDNSHQLKLAKNKYIKLQKVAKRKAEIAVQ